MKYLFSILFLFISLSSYAWIANIYFTNNSVKVIYKCDRDYKIKKDMIIIYHRWNNFDPVFMVHKNLIKYIEFTGDSGD